MWLFPKTFEFKEGMNNWEKAMPNINWPVVIFFYTMEEEEE